MNVFPAKIFSVQFQSASLNSKGTFQEKGLHWRDFFVSRPALNRGALLSMFKKGFGFICELENWIEVAEHWLDSKARHGNRSHSVPLPWFAFLGSWSSGSGGWSRFWYQSNLYIGGKKWNPAGLRLHMKAFLCAEVTKCTQARVINTSHQANLAKYADPCSFSSLTHVFVKLSLHFPFADKPVFPLFVCSSSIRNISIYLHFMML